MAGGHYEKSVYDELVKVMARLDSMKKETDQKISGLNNEISDLKKENKKLRKENELLKEDNTRLKNLLNHDSSNTAKPPSSDQKPVRPANNYNDGKRAGKSREIRIYQDAEGKYQIPERFRSEVVYGPTVKSLAKKGNP